MYEKSQFLLHVCSFLWVSCPYANKKQQKSLFDRVVRLGHKTGHIGPKLDKSRTFSDQISVHFSSPSQVVLKSDLKQSPICPICRQTDILFALWHPCCPTQFRLIFFKKVFNSIPSALVNILQTSTLLSGFISFQCLEFLDVWISKTLKKLLCRT